MVRKISPPTALRSLKIPKETDEAAFDAAQIYSRHRGRKTFSVSAMLRLWIEAGRAVYHAKSDEEIVAAAKSCNSQNPLNQGVLNGL